MVCRPVTLLSRCRRLCGDRPAVRDHVEKPFSKFWYSGRLVEGVDEVLVLRDVDACRSVWFVLELFILSWLQGGEFAGVLDGLQDARCLQTSARVARDVLDGMVRGS